MGSRSFRVGELRFVGEGVLEVWEERGSAVDFADSENSDVGGDATERVAMIIVASEVDAATTLLGATSSNQSELVLLMNSFLALSFWLHNTG